MWLGLLAMAAPCSYAGVQPTGYVGPLGSKLGYTSCLPQHLQCFLTSYRSCLTLHFAVLKITAMSDTLGQCYCVSIDTHPVKCVLLSLRVHVRVCSLHGVSWHVAKQ